MWGGLRSSILVCSTVTALIHFLCKLYSAFFLWFWWKTANLQLVFENQCWVEKFMHYSWDWTSKPEFLFWIIFLCREIRTQVNNDNPQRGFKLMIQPHELIMAFLAWNSYFSISLSPFRPKCHLAAAHESSALLWSCWVAFHGGQHYEDNHVDLTKQNHPPAPDTAQELVKTQQGQILQALDGFFHNCF